MNLSASALAVLGDSREEQGLARSPLWLVEARGYASIYADVDDVDASIYTDASIYADADDVDADTAVSGDADAYASVSAYADADADNSVSNDEQPQSTTKMKNGLYAVTLTQSGRTVLRVGWFRRDPTDPDEYECVWRTPYRDEYLPQLADVWTKGPSAAPAWKWGEAVPSVVHRIHFQPLARLDPATWAELMPRPEGWEP